MGHVYHKVTVEVADQQREVEMFVDTGATFSVFPAALADDLGMIRTGKKYRISLADGSALDRTMVRPCSKFSIVRLRERS